MFSTKAGALRRLALGAALGATATALFATPAGAGAPTRIDDEFWGVSCVTQLEGGLTLFLFGGGTTDGSEGGIGAFVENADGALVAEGQADDFGFGNTFHAGIDLAGTRFTIAADVVVLETESMVVNERDGNRWTKGTQSSTTLEINPTAAAYGGQPVDMSEGGCGGDINAFNVRTTNPSAQIHSDKDFDSQICDVAGLADGQVRVSGALPDAFVEVVLDHGGEDVEKVQGDVRVEGGRGTLTADVLDVFTGDVRTTATIGLVLERFGKSVRTVESGEGMTERRTLTPYQETITVSFADGRKGTATCFGVQVVTQSRVAPAK